MKEVQLMRTEKKAPNAMRLRRVALP